jgi:hypothetical protein
LALRFRKSFRIAPGVKLNIGRKSLSASFGQRGACYTTGTAGRRLTLGPPGTGLFWTTTLARSRLPAIVRPALIFAAVHGVILAAYWR